MTTSFRILIGDNEISYTEVLQWEKRRAAIVLKKLGIKPHADDLPALRQQLLARKMELGADGLLQRLHRELAISNPVASLTARLSVGKRRFSVTRIISSHGSAEAFVAWFNDRTKLNDELAMLTATPDHYVIRTRPDGFQEVVETNGGSPLAAQFYIDYQDLSSLQSQPDPAFPLQIAGVARSAGGVALGGVRHQFRNEGTGFQAKLTVEFPWLILPGVIEGHQWHLASEFSNWILQSQQ